MDILHYLQGSGSFATGTSLGGALGQQVNALLANGTPLLASSYDASAALQVAIWTAEYGSDLTVSASASVLTLANTYLANVASGTWAADPTLQVAQYDGLGLNQTQVNLQPVPEPASLPILAVGLFVLAGARLGRRSSRA